MVYDFKRMFAENLDSIKSEPKLLIWILNQFINLYDDAPKMEAKTNTKKQKKKKNLVPVIKPGEVTNKLLSH